MTIWPGNFLLPLAALAQPAVPPAAPPAPPAPARIEVSVYPARVEAAPGGLSDPITVTVTNGGPLPTSITLTLEGVVGWGAAKAQTAEMTPGGSTVLTMYLRAPGLAGPPIDNILVNARADGDHTITGQATTLAAHRSCHADWDGLGGLGPADILAFLGDFYRRTADFDGVDGTTVFDLYRYLDAFFDGCG